MIKVMSIFGTRPEAIKMAPLVKELDNRKEIEKVFEKIKINNLSVEELIKKGLQILGM